MKTRRFLLVACCAAAFAILPVAAQNAPKVEGAWARPTVEGQAAGGGFLKIVGGAAADRLVAASAGVSHRVELHTMTMDGNIMRMREIDAIDVPAGQTVELKPGGLHVMFMELKAPLKNGSSFPLTLRFEKGGEVTVQMTVMTQPAPAGGYKH